MNNSKMVEEHDFDIFHEPPHLPLGWLGPQRLHLLRLRDRIVPWQVRHFYYRYEFPVRLGGHVSACLVLGHMLTLALRTFASKIALELPNTFPTDIIQAGAILVPGLKRSARRMRFARGKSLDHTAQPAEDIMLLVEGYGRLCMEHEDGRLLTVGLVASGDLFGEEALLDIPERESAFEAVLDSQVEIISREDFTHIISEDTQLLRSVTEHLSQRLLEQQRHMVRLAVEPLERRLAWLLLQLATVTDTSHSSEPTIAIYHKDLAAVLGVWRETITAVLNRWGNEGLISQQPGRITLKEIKRLQVMAED